MNRGFESLPHRFLGNTRRERDCITLWHNKYTEIRLRLLTCRDGGMHASRAHVSGPGGSAPVESALLCARVWKGQSEGLLHCRADGFKWHSDLGGNWYRERYARSLCNA